MEDDALAHERFRFCQHIQYQSDIIICGYGICCNRSVAEILPARKIEFSILAMGCFVGYSPAGRLLGGLTNPEYPAAHFRRIVIEHRHGDTVEYLSILCVVFRFTDIFQRA